jgi:DNA polymerase V
MNSDAMEGAGIFCGDILIVDRSIEIAPDKIILAIVNNELLIRFLKIAGGKRYFQAANTKFSTIQLTEASKIRFVGVVTCVLHLFETNLCPLFGEKVK